MNFRRLMTRSQAGACLLVGATLAACAATQERPECSDARLAEIEAAYVAEVLAACDGQHFDTCLERVKIDKRYDALREEWIQCR